MEPFFPFIHQHKEKETLLPLYIEIIEQPVIYEKPHEKNEDLEIIIIDIW